LFVLHVAPVLPAGRSWADPRERETFADLVIDTITAHAPNFKASVIARQVLSPPDLKTRFGAHRRRHLSWATQPRSALCGSPVLGHADYRMPLAGLYLCGSGAQHGGGVTGLPGRNAARTIIKDLPGGRLAADFAWAG
jgi:phytoene dehydrogenase-like protein